MNQTNIEKIKQNKEKLLLLAFHAAYNPNSHSEIARTCAGMDFKVYGLYPIDGPSSPHNDDALWQVYHQLKPVFDENKSNPVKDADLLNLEVTLKDVVGFSGSEEDRSSLVKLTSQRYHAFR